MELEVLQNVLYKDVEIYIYIFFIYAFLGWCMESFGSIINPNVKKFVNRGFLIGPYCPVYGLGVVLISILLAKYKDDPITVFLLSIIICGTLEYFTSWILEKIFGARWWDYSKRKYNINGRVCLETLIPFGLFGMGTLCIFNPKIIEILMFIPEKIFVAIAWSLFCVFVIDGIISFVIINSFKNIAFKSVDNTEQISNMVKETTEKAKEELVDKAEDFVMKTASEAIYQSRKRRIKNLRRKNRIRRKYLNNLKEQNKKFKESLEELRYQAKLLNYKAKEEREKLENLFDSKLKYVKTISKEKTDKVKRELKDKSIWYKRLVDSYPNFELMQKEKLKIDKKELKKKKKKE